MRRLATALLVLCLLVSPSLFAVDRETRSPRERDRGWISRVVKEVIRHFRPASSGDGLSIPRP